MRCSRRSCARWPRCVFWGVIGTAFWGRGGGSGRLILVATDEPGWTSILGESRPRFILRTVIWAPLVRQANGVVAECFAVSSLLNSQLGPKHILHLSVKHTHKLKCKGRRLHEAHPCCCCRWFYLRARGRHPARGREATQFVLLLMWLNPPPRPQLPPTPPTPRWSPLLWRRGSHPAQRQLRGCQKLWRGSRSAVCLPRPPHSPRFRSEAVTRRILSADGTGGRRIPGIAREARQEGFGFHQNRKETARETLPLAFFFFLLCLNDVGNL